MLDIYNWKTSLWLKNWKLYTNMPILFIRVDADVIVNEISNKGRPHSFCGNISGNTSKKNELKILPFDHIDIMPLPIGQASLKSGGGRLHAPGYKICRLDRRADKHITTALLREYCHNDLNTTRFYTILKAANCVTRQMSEQYNASTYAQIRRANSRGALLNTN